MTEEHTESAPGTKQTTCFKRGNNGLWGWPKQYLLSASFMSPVVIKGLASTHTSWQFRGNRTNKDSHESDTYSNIKKSTHKKRRMSSIRRRPVRRDLLCRVGVSKSRSSGQCVTQRQGDRTQRVERGRAWLHLAKAQDDWEWKSEHRQVGDGRRSLRAQQLMQKPWALCKGDTKWF